MKKVCMAVVLFVLLMNGGVSVAAPGAQEEGQVYVVQSGDWLAKVAAKFYGDAQAWPVIIEATNARAESDSSFAVIADSGQIEVGQKLWIPDQVEKNDLELAYTRAIWDAKVAEAHEIAHDLIAIVEGNDDLIWKEAEGETYVLVVTWTSWDGYDDKVGQAIDTVDPYYTWVTVSPELQTFCTTFPATGDALALRMEQLLGLPSDTGKNRFVEIWVRPQDLFRPSPDPEISDHETELTFPTSHFTTISEAYKAWFDDLNGKSYGEGGYPWTRLGYTYDWGNAESEVGLSEFVIGTGVTIEIAAVSSNEVYCKK